VVPASVREEARHGQASASLLQGPSHSYEAHKPPLHGFGMAPRGKRTLEGVGVSLVKGCSNADRLFEWLLLEVFGLTSDWLLKATASLRDRLTFGGTRPHENELVLEDKPFKGVLLLPCAGPRHNAVQGLLRQGHLHIWSL
jgi:hypothetical protein